MEDGNRTGIIEGNDVTNDWEWCSKVVQEHSEQTIRRWQEEIDMLLVYAGLFSAIVTAFSAGSYPLLQPDQQGDILATLQVISAHMQASPNTSVVVVSEDTAHRGRDGPFNAPTYAIWINSLWFSALVCTLSASSLAIMVRQWLRQYSSGLSGNSRTIARLRQYRFDNLHRWRVPLIVTLLPVILQLALILFLVGLLIFLWSLHRVVAVITSSFITATFICIAATTILPAMKADCPYQSPQARCLFVTLRFLGQVASWPLVGAENAIRATQRYCKRPFFACTMSRRLAYLRYNLTRWNEVHDWELREDRAMRSIVSDIDLSILWWSYLTTLNNALLETVIVRCSRSFDALSFLHSALSMLQRTTDMDTLFWYSRTVENLDVQHRHALGPQDVRFHVFLLSECLRVLLRYLQTSNALDPTISQNIVPSILALVPPRTWNNGKRFIFYNAPVPVIPRCLMLGLLANLVCNDLSPSLAFYKLAVHIDGLDVSEHRHGYWTLDRGVLQSVVAAFPKNAERWHALLDWEDILASYHTFSAMTKMLHVVPLCIVDNQALVQELQRGVLISVETILRHTAWRSTARRRRVLMNAVGTDEFDADVEDHPAFLPTLLQLASDESTKGLITTGLWEALKDTADTIRITMHADSPSSTEFWHEQIRALDRTLQGIHTYRPATAEEVGTV
ncbi:hypothetical protein GY45DRAFT_224355 [Cubamyces sp. BRFM 1775]|nr:hypothetical protein GY45DRAFT_224355 [Cubamyces sp. BRFM 1775]